MRDYSELEIPAFLLRKLEEDARTGAGFARRKPAKVKRNADQVTLHLDDQVPKLGSGFRTVTIVKRGRLWIVVQANGVKVRIRLSLWDTLRKRLTDDNGNLIPERKA